MDSHPQIEKDAHRFMPMTKMHVSEISRGFQVNIDDTGSLGLMAAGLLCAYDSINTWPLANNLSEHAVALMFSACEVRCNEDLMLS